MERCILGVLRLNRSILSNATPGSYHQHCKQMDNHFTCNHKSENSSVTELVKFPFKRTLNNVTSNKNAALLIGQLLSVYNSPIRFRNSCYIKQEAYFEFEKRPGDEFRC